MMIAARCSGTSRLRRLYAGAARHSPFGASPHASPALIGEVGKQQALRGVSLNSMSIVKNFGAGDGIRTHDPNLGKGVPYLSGGTTEYPKPL